MFQVIVQKIKDNDLQLQQVVSVDCLSEAEEAAIVLARKHFHSSRLVLIYIVDLTYAICELSKPIGQVHIKTM